MVKCRVCDRKAKYILTNITMTFHPFVCGIHARSLPYSTMNKIGFIEQKESRAADVNKEMIAKK